MVKLCRSPLVVEILFPSCDTFDTATLQVLYSSLKPILVFSPGMFCGLKMAFDFRAEVQSQCHALYCQIVQTGVFSILQFFTAEDALFFKCKTAVVFSLRIWLPLFCFTYTFPM